MTMGFGVATKWTFHHSFRNSLSLIEFTNPTLLSSMTVAFIKRTANHRHQLANPNLHNTVEVVRLLGAMHATGLFLCI
jgi:hypothetical protein